MCGSRALVRARASAVSDGVALRQRGRLDLYPILTTHSVNVLGDSVPMAPGLVVAGALAGDAGHEQPSAPGTAGASAPQAAPTVALG